MAEEIVNRVANSKLQTINLEDLYPEGKRVRLDISDWLVEGLVLREKEFRMKAKSHDWDQYRGSYVAMFCATDAIIPAWAFLLLTSYLAPVARRVGVGDLELLETILFSEALAAFDVSPFEGLPVIIKGCSRKPVPPNAYIDLLARLQPVAKSIMFGEACSSVPLYKK